MMKTIALASLLFFALVARAEDPAPPQGSQALPPGEKPPTPEELKALLEAMQKEQEEFNKQVGFKIGPLDGDMGIATLKVPDGFLFTDGAGAKKWGELTSNPVSGKEIGLAGAADGSWLVLFEFDDIGYVKDDEKDDLDHDALLASIRDGTHAFNEQVRVPRGLPPLNIVGWEQKPAYNEQAHVLEWCVRAESGGEPSLNFNTRVLGRRGVVMVTLMFGGDVTLQQVLPQFRTFMQGFAFKPGETYAEFKEGDKIAEYGLAALVAGGGVALAAKSGLLGKLGTIFAKAGKVILVAAIAILGGIASLVRRALNKKD